MNTIARFIASGIALIGLIVLIAFLAPMVVPTSAYKQTLEEQASAAIGRVVRFGDDIKIRFLPSTAFTVSEIVVENPEGFSQPTLLTLRVNTVNQSCVQAPNDTDTCVKVPDNAGVLPFALVTALGLLFIPRLRDSVDI